MKSSLRSTFILGLLLAVPSFAFAAPGIPNQFYGTAKYTDGTAITSGSVIVKIGATEVASVPISAGKYGYNPNLLLVTDPDNNRVGATLVFYIGTVNTGKTSVFVNGGYKNLNLDISPQVVTETPAPTSSGGGGGGGGGFVQTISTVSTLSAAAEKVDSNHDGKIDVLDFVALMANWGKSGFSNIADFNGDGRVDILDFIALMVNWTK